MKATVKQLVSSYRVGNRNLNQAQVSVILTLLEAAGQAKKVGKVDKVEGQRGKTADIWEVPEKIEFSFSPRNVAIPAGE